MSFAPRRRSIQELRLNSAQAPLGQRPIKRPNRQRQWLQSCAPYEPPLSICVNLARNTSEFSPLTTGGLPPPRRTRGEWLECATWRTPDRIASSVRRKTCVADGGLRNDPKDPDQ